MTTCTPSDQVVTRSLFAHSALDTSPADHSAVSSIIQDCGEVFATVGLGIAHVSCTIPPILHTFRPSIRGSAVSDGLDISNSMWNGAT